MDIHAEDLTNRSLYIICHASDVDNLRRCHADGKSTYYHQLFLARILDHLDLVVFVKLYQSIVFKVRKLS